MSIRLPRAKRTPRRTRFFRELAIITVMAGAVVVFGLRVLLQMLGVDTWTAPWRVVNAPTSIVTSILERFEPLRTPFLSDLNGASLLSLLVVGMLTMLVLGTLSNRRVAE